MNLRLVTGTCINLLLDDLKGFVRGPVSSFITETINFILYCYASWEPEPCIEISRAGAGVVLLPGPINVIPDMCEINYFTSSPPGPGTGMIYEPHHEKTGFLPRRKQRRRSASR